MTKETVEGIGSFYQHTCRCPVVLTARAGGRSNAMAVGRHMLLSSRPPVYAVSIMPARFTYRLIIESKEFGINFLPFGMVKLVDAVGTISGHDGDKFQKLSIAVDQPIKTTVPILKDAYAACECRLIDDRAYGENRLLVGEVVAAHVLSGTMTPKKVLDLGKVQPIVSLGYQHYASVPLETVECIERS